jgi:hypothetical protein
VGTSEIPTVTIAAIKPQGRGKEEKEKSKNKNAAL